MFLWPWLRRWSRSSTDHSTGISILSTSQMSLGKTLSRCSPANVDARASAFLIASPKPGYMHLASGRASGVKSLSQIKYADHTNQISMQGQAGAQVASKMETDERVKKKCSSFLGSYWFQLIYLWTYKLFEICIETLSILISFQSHSMFSRGLFYEHSQDMFLFSGHTGYQLGYQPGISTAEQSIL